jgi:GR25 family glycosyltransferase involved in LPS biosynthesis
MNNPFDFFDKIYCINMPNALARKEAVAKEFKKVGILDRIEWVNTPIDLKDSDTSWQTNYKHKGEYGCSLSHNGAVGKAYDEEAENVLIFEDDVQFLYNTLETLEKAIKELPEDWDFFYLGGRPIDKLKTISKNLSKIEGNFPLCHAYAINKKSILPFYGYGKSAMKKFHPFSMNDHASWMYLKEHEKNGYVVDPYIAKVAEGHSFNQNGYRHWNSLMHDAWVQNGRAQQRTYITGVDSNLQDLLPWWVRNIRKYDKQTHITVADFGMDKQWLEWAEKNVNHVLKYPKHEKCAWFWKPHTLKAAPYEYKCWIDIDCEVLANCSEIFDLVDGTNIGLTNDPCRSRTNQSEKWYATGVNVVKGEPDLLTKWIKASRNTEQRGDQEVMHELLKDEENLKSITEIDMKYQWLRIQLLNGQDNNKKKIIHWTGPAGKEIIRRERFNSK